MLPVFLDTCVLLKSYLCDTLLSIAETGVYRPLWSPMVMIELERNLTRRGLDEKQVAHRVGQMSRAFPSTPVGWARYFGQPALAGLLESRTPRS